MKTKYDEIIEEARLCANPDQDVTLKLPLTWKGAAIVVLAFGFITLSWICIVAGLGRITGWW